MFVYVRHRAERFASSAQRCDRSATDRRTAARSSTRPPPRQTAAQETHVHSAYIVPADNVNRGDLPSTEHGKWWGGGEIQRQSIVNWIQGQRLHGILYLLFCFPDTWRLKHHLLEHLPLLSLPAHFKARRLLDPWATLTALQHTSYHTSQLTG